MMMRMMMTLGRHCNILMDCCKSRSRVYSSALNSIINCMISSVYSLKHKFHGLDSLWSYLMLGYQL